MEDSALFGLGVYFPFVFLVGGGVVTATNGGYWTMMFVTAYLLGLTSLGPAVYTSVFTSTCNTCGSPATSHSAVPRWLPGIGFALSFVLPFAFLRSDVFAPEVGIHFFMICIGEHLSLFVPLGLGMLHRPGAPRESEIVS